SRARDTPDIRWPPRVVDRCWIRDQGTEGRGRTGTGSVGEGTADSSAPVPRALRASRLRAGWRPGGGAVARLVLRGDQRPDPLPAVVAALYAVVRRPLEHELVVDDAAALVRSPLGVQQAQGASAPGAEAGLRLLVETGEGVLVGRPRVGVSGGAQESEAPGAP